MAQRDRYHQHVKNALIKDGWTITHDPLRLIAGTQNVFVDLGAERIIAAERADEEGRILRIAIEVKSFLSISSVADLEQAVGQYLLYRGVLIRTEPDRILYLAISKHIYDTVFGTLLGQIALMDYGVKVVACDMDKEEVKLWT
jgi:hypothetical protein